MTNEPGGGASLSGLREFLIDHAAEKRAQAEGLVGGYRNRTIAEAKDCERWAAALKPDAS